MVNGDYFERIFDSCHMLVAYLDPRCNFLRVNRAYAEADGRTADFFPGRNHFELYPDAENEAVFRRVAATGEPHTAWGRPFRYKDHPERGTTWWDWTLEAVRGERGEVEGLILTLVDVSARVVAEAERDEARRNQEVIDRLLRLGLERMPLAEMLQRALEIVVSVSFLEADSRGALFLAEAGGDSLVMAAARSLPDTVRSRCGRVVAGKCLCGRAATERLPLFVPADDDRHLPLEGMERHAHYCVPLLSGESLLGVLTLFVKAGHIPRDDERRFLQAVADVLAATIRNRQLAEDQEQARAALLQSEERLQSLLQAAPDAIISGEADGNVLWCNQAAARIFGYRAAEIRGQPMTRLLPPSSHAAYRRALEEARRREGAAGQGGHELVALVGLRSCGQEFPLELSLAFWGQGRQRYVTAILRDVTARKKLEEQYLQAQKMEAVGRLTGGVAHDFNNLLSCVIGYTDLALRDAATAEPLRANLEIVLEAGRKAADLTRQLLAFSRKQVLEVGPVSLNRTVADFLKLLRKTIGEDIEIVPRTRAVNDVILADRGQLEQVLMNLAVNARDAMPDGGRLFIETGDLTVEAGGREAEDGIGPGVYVVLEVRDTGVGMCRETLSRIFDPFFTTKGAGHGTGLGLATVSGIVAQHRGHIRASSEPGRGACFRVYWPAAAAEAEAAGPAEAGPERCGGGKVLVVDDDEHVRQLVCDVLENHGCRCMAAASGEEALAIPAEKLREVDLVMTDVIMSGMNGREMAERLRQRHPAAAIVFMSGYTDEVITRHGVLEEGVHFLAKPLTVSAILTKVNEVLAGGLAHPQ